MIRTRLSIAFLVLSALALAQCAFAWWATLTATDYAERSVVAAGMQAEYESIGGNKQRLKVWFAEAMLTGNAPELTRMTLVSRIQHSLVELNALAERDSLLRGEPSPEWPTIRALENNIETTASALREAIPLLPVGDPAAHWRTVLQAFDRLGGQDMREVIREAILRQDRLAASESDRLTRSLDVLRRANTALALGALVLGLLAVGYFLSRLQRPFARLGAVTARFARGELSARSGLVGRDEFSQLGALLDSMAERLQDAQARDAELRRSLDELVAARTRAVTDAHEAMLRVETRRRQFFAEVSHELRTPVTVIRGEAEVALRGHGDREALCASLQRIADAAGELSGRVQDLLDAARSGSHDYAFALAPLPIADLVAAVAAQMQALARYREVSLHLELPVALQAVRVHGDAGRLQQALTIVLDNALRYTSEHGTVWLTLQADADWVRIEVADDGPGMSAEELEQASTPHFRGLHARRSNPNGAGLGLAIAGRILAVHGGTLELCPRSPQGLRAVLHLPIEESA